MSFFAPKQKRIYLDYAAATPVRPEVWDIMLPYFSQTYANPSAVHAEGVAARAAVEAARERIARTLEVRTADVFFTGSGTESNNLGILGTLYARRAAGVAYSDMEVITTELEHPSVKEALRAASGLGVSVALVPVDGDGRIVASHLRELLSPKTVLVTFAYVNSEIGVIQDVGALARIVRAYEREHNQHIHVHLDAAQAPLWLSCVLERLQVDSLTLDAGKCYGPKGVGILARRHGVELAPVLYGGPQEHGLRPATENVPGIVGAAEAIVRAQAKYADRSAKVTKIRDAGLELLLQLPGVVVNGSREHRVANNINLSLPGFDAEYMVVVLDAAGIACSTKSACSGADSGGSSVVRAISDGDEARARSTVRLTLGERSTVRDIARVRDVLTAHIERMTPYQEKLTGN